MSCGNRKHILEIQNLSVSFEQYASGTEKTLLPVISDLNVAVHEGEIVAVVGASGSGKSLLVHAVMGMLPANARVSGQIRYREEPLDEKRLAGLRGRGISLVPQSVNCLDPLMRIGKQVCCVRRERKGRELLSGYREQKKEDALRRRELFERYGLPEDALKKYPFECSGGMCRRIMLAMALMDRPDLILADEPTPGLDTGLAVKAMEDFRRFADEGNGVLLITHDIELALRAADRIAVFYAGTTVEEAFASDFEREELLRHPYTRALWRAMPGNGFSPIEGSQPYVTDLPQGCVFGPRCPDRGPECLGPIPVRSVRCGTVKCVRCPDDGSHRRTGSAENCALAREEKK